ncbi:hypothetical protein PFISCL1PPCAC_26094, partial [Pristionchus fissidentatus]
YFRAICVKGALYNKIYDCMLKRYPAQFYSIVPLTSRARRDFEIEGFHYHFVSTDLMREFEMQNTFIELASRNGNLYGLDIGGV